MRGDARVEAKKFGDVVSLDTLFMTRSADGKVVEVESGSDAKGGQVMHDAATGDVEYFPVPNRAWQHVKNALIEFGGPVGTIKNCVADRAPEFRKALLDLKIAPLGSTPGRSTSNAEQNERIEQFWK